MKKVILWMMAATFFCANANAEEVRGYDDTKHEVAISTGAGTNTQIVSGFSKLAEVVFGATMTTVFSGGTLTGHTMYENEKEFIPVSAEYFYHLTPLVRVGGILCYNGTSHDMYGNLQNNSNGDTKKVLIGTGSVTNITLMPAVKLDWMRSTYFGMYSKFAIGATLMMEREKLDFEGKQETIHDKNELMFNWQASLLGIEAGYPNARVFAELGCGEQGIILAGLRCKF